MSDPTLEELAERHPCVRAVIEARDRLEQNARETFLQFLSDEAQYDENYERRLAAEARLARVMRYFHLANEDRRFAWDELRRENEYSVETRKKLAAAERTIEDLRAAIEMERGVNLASGCPDCGVHDGCDRVVAERERYREVVTAFQEHWNRVAVLDGEDPHVKSIENWFRRLAEAEGT